MLSKINLLLTYHDKVFLILLIIFSIFISLMETFAISIVMPFISIANDFSIIEKNDYFVSVYNFFNMKSPNEFVVYLGLFLFLFYIARSAINVFYFYMLAKFSEGRFFFISRRLFETYLKLENKKFNTLNTSYLTKMIINEASYFTQVISSLLFMISEIFVIIFIYAILLYVDWESTLFLSLILMIVVGLILLKITKLVKTKGKEREIYQRSIYDILSSSFGNFKVIKLFSNEKKVIESFSDTNRKFVHANITFETFSHVPRLVLDALGFASLSLVIAFLVWKHNSDISAFMPILALYILALYRLLPSIHRIIVRYNKIMFYSKSIELVYDELSYKKEKLGVEKIEFHKQIELRDVCFGYDDNEVLSGVKLTINKGDNIGIVGESGSGKSTLVDILMGLNLPSMGHVHIDGNELSMKNIASWRTKIGYIPQSVYLFDGTVSENIIFGRAFDYDKLKDVLIKVELWKFFEQRDGLDTEVGEEGKLLSGGQKQRMAIARALYLEPEILILDEATSALDSKIESNIMKEIYLLCKDKTVIIISHNESILYGCDKRYHVVNGRVL